MTESAEGRLRAALDEAFGNGPAPVAAIEKIAPIIERLVREGFAAEREETYLCGMQDGKVTALDQAAGQIKALPIYGLKFLYRDDVLAAVLREMRDDDA